MADKKELLRFCGSLEQAAGVRRIEYQDGRASGLRCALVQNGPLEFLLMLDKCLDPAWIRYKGLNMSFLSKPGLQGIRQAGRRYVPLWAEQCLPAAWIMSLGTGRLTGWSIRRMEESGQLPLKRLAWIHFLTGINTESA